MPPRAVRPGRRGQRADRADRAVGAARGVPPGARVAGRRAARRCPSRSTSRRSSSAARGSSTRVRAHPRRDRARPAPARARADRERADGERGRDGGRAARAEGDGPAARGGRLRHRLLEPQLPDAVPDRRAEGGPVVRARDHGDGGRIADHHRGDQHGQEPEAPGHRRGGRDAGAAGVPAGAALRGGPGLPLQPAARRPTSSRRCWRRNRPRTRALLGWRRRCGRRGRGKVAAEDL